LKFKFKCFYQHFPFFVELHNFPPQSSAQKKSDVFLGGGGIFNQKIIMSDRKRGEESGGSECVSVWEITFEL